MRQLLQRTRTHLELMRDQHEPMKAALELLLKEYSDALQPPIRRMVNFVHKAQRLIKICETGIYSNAEVLKKLLNSPDPIWSMMPGLPVEVELTKALARDLFQSSGAVSGERIIIAVTEEGRDVAEEVIALCMQNQVDFELGIKDAHRGMVLINHLDESQLQKLANLTLEKYEGVHREIIISSSTNPDIKEQIDTEKRLIYRMMNQKIHDMAMSGKLHYTLTRIPNAHDAELDEMEYEEYLKLFFELCDQPWKEIQLAQEALKKKFDMSKSLHISNNDGTNITLNIEGMTFANSVIAKNIPGSEIFSAPRKDGVDGVVVAKGRFHYGASGIMENFRFEFEKGKLIKYSAEVGQEDLKNILEADNEQGEGTKFVGEIGIGTNPHMRQHVVNSLLVEKIGGSFHLALGSCYTYDEYLGEPVTLNNGNVSQSGTHWDITTLLRGKDGRMEIDGELIQENGDWIGAEFEVLNQGWGALAEEDQPHWWKENFSNGY
ncbi:MAG: aminopeptidase [Candidatus Gracilibacteria bacterium]|nr:aminopeptidase [Candidatus Gracilibacteria bacterium]